MSSFGVFPELSCKILLGLLGLGLKGVDVALASHPKLHLLLLALTKQRPNY